MIATPTELRLTQVERNGVVCLRPEGELDQATLEPLAQGLDRGEVELALRTQADDAVAFDLGEAERRSSEHGATVLHGGARPAVLQGDLLGRGWQCSHASGPRPAATILRTAVPQRGHGSPARRWTRNSSWKEPMTPSA